MGNAGEARLDVLQVGKDELTAAVNTVNATLDAMRAKLAQYEKSQRETTTASQAATKAIVDQITALQGEQKALAAVGAGAGPAAVENQKKLAELTRTHNSAIDAQVAAMQRELAAMQQLGAAQGPLGQVRAQEIAALEGKRVAVVATTSADTVATKAMAEAEQASGGLAAGLGKTWSAARVLVNVLPGLGMSGLIGGIIAGFEALFDLLSGSDAIPEYTVDITRAANAQFELSKQVAQSITEANKGMVAINDLRVATLKLAAANASAVGDDKKSAELLRAAGLKAIEGEVAKTQTALDDLSKSWDDVTNKAAESEAQTKGFHNEVIRAEFEWNQAIAAGNERGQGFAFSAITQATVAEQLAIKTAQDARQEAAKIGEQIQAQNAQLREQKKKLELENAKSAGDITLGETLIAPKDASRAATHEATKDLREFTQAQRDFYAELDKHARQYEHEQSTQQALRDQIELMGARNDGDRKDIELRQKLAEIDRQVEEGKLLSPTADLDRKLLGMRREKDAADALAQSYREFANVITNVVGPAAPELAGMLKSIGDLYVAIQVGGEGAAKGIVSSIDGILQANAAWFKTQQEKDAYLGAEQILLGIATQFVPGLQAEAEGHFIAGAGLLLLAAASGGGGGGARGGGGGGSSRSAATSPGGNPALGGGSSGGGPSTVIYNIEVSPSTDPQGVGRAIRQASYATRGTGNDQRTPGV